MKLHIFTLEVNLSKLLNLKWNPVFLSQEIDRTEESNFKLDIEITSKFRPETKVMNWKLGFYPENFVQ